MSPRHRPVMFRLARLLLTGLLVLGMLANPVLAAACEIGDLQKAGGGAASAVAAPAADVDAHGDDVCCPGQACGQCCVAGAGIPTRFEAAALVRALAAGFEFVPRGLAPAAHPAPIRPPIPV